MRILFLVSSMEGGGAERVAAQLCNRWADQGHTVVLMPTFSGRGGCAYPLDPRVRLDHLADRVTRPGRGPRAQLQRVRALRAAVRGHAPSVVVSFLPRVNVAALLATAGTPCPVVVSKRFYPPALALDPLTRVLRRRLYPRAAAVVVQTEAVRRWIAGRCAGARVEVIPNAAPETVPDSPPEVAPDTVVPPGAEVILAAGRLAPEKGFDLLIDAFARLAPVLPGWHLVVLGEGAEWPDLAARVTHHDLSARVHLPGRAGNMRAWYDRASVFALSSRTEGFPNVLLEAMSAGVAPVSFDCATGPGDIVRDGVDGRLVAPAAGAEGLAAALAELIEDASTRARLAARARDVVTRFDAESIGRRWDSLLARAAPPS